MACRNHPKRQREWQRNSGLCYECAKKEGSRLYDKQAGRCDICGDPLGLRNLTGAVPSSAKLDHDHDSGQVRGVLCHRCNLGLGHFRHDPSQLRAAAAYLDEWRQKGKERST